MNNLTHTNNTQNLSFWARPLSASFTSSLSASLLACLLAVGISACGGGGGNEVISVTPPATTPEVPPATLITAGAYVGTLAGKLDKLPKDFVTILLPTEPASGGVTKFYALHYDDANPDIYSGTGQITGKATASLAQVNYQRYFAPLIRSGTGTLNSISSGKMNASLNFPLINSENALEIKDLELKFPTSYIYNTAATLSSVQGNWLGVLSYSNGSNDAYSISISSTGTLSSYMSFWGDCQLSKGEIKPNFDGTNLYKVSVSIPAANACTQNNLGNKDLTGAAFITTSPIAGKTQRLYLVGVTSDGRGISFRADR
jgi:hypothetical protein